MRHVLCITVEFDTRNGAELPATMVKGSFDSTLDAFQEQMGKALNNSIESTAIVTVELSKKIDTDGLNPAQVFHGERIQARGRHNGTSEA